MGITVRDTLQIGGLREATVLAGHKGLDRLVEFVDVMEMPDVEEWVKPGMMLLTTFYAIRSDPQAQVDLVRIMAQRGAAALVLEPTLYLGEVPQEILAAADTWNLPVLQVPPSVSWIQISTPVLGAITNSQAAALKASEEIRREMTAVVLEGKGLSAITDLLSKWVELPVAILLEGGELLARSLPPSSRAEERPPSLGDAHTWLIRVGKQVLGYLAVWNGGANLDELQAAAVDTCLTTAALELMKQRAIEETETRLRAELLEDFLDGQFTSEHSITSRASRFGWDFRHKRLVMVADIDQFEQYCLTNAHKGEEHVQQVKNAVWKLVSQAVRRQAGEKTILEPVSDSIIILPEFPGAPPHEIVPHSLALAHAVMENLRAAPAGITMSIGIGRPCSHFRDLPRSYRQAKEALRIGAAAYGQGRITPYDELGVYRLLALLEGHEELRQFYEETIAPLDRHDRKNRTSLAETLDAFLRYDGNVTRTARALYVHRNTLKYRLARIREILGDNLHDGEKKLRLMLALKIKRLLGL